MGADSGLTDSVLFRGRTRAQSPMNQVERAKRGLVPVTGRTAWNLGCPRAGVERRAVVKLPTMKEGGEIDGGRTNEHVKLCFEQLAG